MLQIFRVITGVVLSSAISLPVIAATCEESVQGRIAWDDRGSTHWSPANIRTLCAGAEDSVEPAGCFRTVMHGGIDTGGKVNWREVVALCAGTLDHLATVECFSERIGAGLSRAEAIDACSWDTASGQPREAVEDTGPTLIVKDLPAQATITAPDPAPTIRHRLNVVEHLCINNTCEFGDESWDKTDREKAYDGTESTSFVPDVRNATLVRLCPERRATTDREFGGNGPSIQARTAVEKTSDTLQLMAWMLAQETGSGTSYAAKTWRGDLYRAPPGWIIVDYSPRISETAYTDSNHEEDVPPVRGGALASQFRFKGDTDGDDIGNCTTDDTYMTIAYNPVSVTLRARRGDLRQIRIRRALWELGLTDAIRRLTIRINNYDRTQSQPENGVPENRYFIDHKDPSSWATLSDAEIRAGSYFSYDSSPSSAASVAPTPLPVPEIRRNTFTFLLNDINAPGRRNSVDPVGDHIRFTIGFESSDPEIVAACVDNIACGTGEPHEAGKPLVQVDNLRIYPYLRPRVDRSGGPLIRAELTRVRMEADIRRDGTCRDNAFAWACGAFAGDIEKIAYEAILDQLNAFVRGSAALTGLLDQQLTNGICAIASSMGEDCSAMENIVLDENGDLLLWTRD